MSWHTAAKFEDNKVEGFLSDIESTTGRALIGFYP